MCGSRSFVLLPTTEIEGKIGMSSREIAEFGLVAGRGVLLGLVSLVVVVLGAALPMGLQWVFKF